MFIRQIQWPVAIALVSLLVWLWVPQGLDYYLEARMNLDEKRAASGPARNIPESVPTSTVNDREKVEFMLCTT